VCTAQAQDNKGTDFVLGFMENLPGPNENVILFITGDTATNGTVDIPGLAFSVPFAVVPGTITSVSLPLSVRASGSDVVQNRGIHITAAEEVVVYGLNQRQYTTDGFLGLPSDILGTEHVLLGFEAASGVEASEFIIVGVEDGTSVTITPSMTTGARTAGIPYNIVLNRFETYQLVSDNIGDDTSGTTVVSDKPVSIFSGARCTDVPTTSSACDHLVEHIPPTATWGTSFLTVSLATRTGGDFLRVVARDDNTDIFLDGAFAATINQGDFHQFDLASGTFHEIGTSSPALVMQYSKGSTVDNVTSDPFMMMIPPTEQFLNTYTLTTPAASPVAFNNFINIAVPTADIAACTIDGGPFTAVFTPIGASGFSGAQESVAIGVHNLACPNGFGAYSYGFASFDSYGYPGGLALAPIAEPGLSKELTSGPDVNDDGEIDIVVEVGQTVTTQYDFTLTYNPDVGNPYVVILDTLPAEWQLIEVNGVTSGNSCISGGDNNGGSGTIDVAPANGKCNQQKGATKIEWIPDPNQGNQTLNVVASTRTGKGGPHGLFSPTSCGKLTLNDGAIAYKADEWGELVLDEYDNPIILFGPTQSLMLVAVEDLNGGGVVPDGSGNEDGDAFTDAEEVLDIGSDPCSFTNDFIIDLDGVASPFVGIVQEVASGNALTNWPTGFDPDNHGIDSFDTDGNGVWTFGTNGDDIHIEGISPACPTGVRNAQHVKGSDCVVLDINGSLQNAEPVSCDLESGSFCPGGYLSGPIGNVAFFDTNGDGFWDNGEDIVLDGNANGLFD
jgi:hypothetical protein